MRENVGFYDTCLAVSMSGDEKCDLRCQLRILRGTTHVCVGSLYLPAPEPLVIVIILPLLRYLPLKKRS